MSIEPMPKSWRNGRAIPPEAVEATVVLGVGKVNGYKIGDVVYTWQSAGAREPLIPWGTWSVQYPLRVGLNPTSNDPHVEHPPSGLRFPIKWNNGCPHILQSQQRELEMAERFDWLPEPETIPKLAVRMFACHLKGLII